MENQFTFLQKSCFHESRGDCIVQINLEASNLVQLFKSSLIERFDQSLWIVFSNHIFAQPLLLLLKQIRCLKYYPSSFSHRQADITQRGSIYFFCGCLLSKFDLIVLWMHIFWCLQLSFSLGIFSLLFLVFYLLPWHLALLWKLAQINWSYAWFLKTIFHDTFLFHCGVCCLTSLFLFWITLLPICPEKFVCLVHLKRKLQFLKKYLLNSKPGSV